MNKNNKESNRLSRTKFETLPKNESFISCNKMRNAKI